MSILGSEDATFRQLGNGPLHGLYCPLAGDPVDREGSNLDTVCPNESRFTQVKASAALQLRGWIGVTCPPAFSPSI